MKNQYPLLLLLLISSLAYAQSDSLRDYRWQIGFASNPTNLDFGGTDFNFHENPVALTYQYRDLNFQLTNASICDVNGELLFYSNGIQICNQFGDTITNGNGLNPGIFADDAALFGYRVPNGAFVLPDPNNEQQYYLIHESYDINEVGETATSFKFYYTLVDMSTPEGQVVSKNNLILADTFDVGHTTAVRHGNGRDWWILKPRFDSNVFHTFLLGPTGVLHAFVQEVGEPIDRNGGASQAVFSPDGTKYARNDGSLIAGPQYVKLYDFDRCSGLLSNFQEVVLQDSSWGSGIAFSPNSRYLYSSVTARVYQFDTEASDLGGSQELIAEWAGEYCPAYPLAANFFMMQPGPDQKIYINSTNGVNCMHVIHEPDNPGLSCDLEIGGLPLPTYNSFSLPHFPNYRLGALTGSPCDSLGLVDAPDLPSDQPTEIALYPNPCKAGEAVYMEYPPGPASVFRWYNALGELVLEEFSSAQWGPVLALATPGQPGLYFLEASDDGGVAHSWKVVVQ